MHTPAPFASCCAEYRQKMPAMMLPAVGSKPTGVAAATSTFIGTPAVLTPHHRRTCVRQKCRLSTQAILEKVRETIAPSNGAITDWKPKSDTASIKADVLQNLGECLGCDRAL